MADPVAQHIPVRVGGILYVRRACVGKEFFYTPAVNVEERPDDVVPAVTHAAQAVKRAAAEDVHEDGLGVVPGIMRDGDHVEFALGSDRVQEPVTVLPRTLLQAFAFCRGEDAHGRGTGSKYTRARLPVRLVWHEAFETKGEAMRREAAVKRLTRKEKEALIARFRENAEKQEGEST